jgi:hypothetical protein
LFYNSVTPLYQSLEPSFQSKTKVNIFSWLLSLMVNVMLIAVLFVGFRLYSSYDQ